MGGEAVKGEVRSAWAVVLRVVLLTGLMVAAACLPVKYAAYVVLAAACYLLVYVGRRTPVV